MTYDTIFNTLIKELSQVPYQSHAQRPTYHANLNSYKVFEENNSILQHTQT